MKLFEYIFKRLLLTESVSVSDVENAIDRHNRIIINYHSKGEDKNTGARVIEVYAYGLTKAGNQVIRAFQPYGDTTTRVPSWKFFRLDRISAWKPTKQIFDRPADFYYKGLGDFNENGDETMSVVYKIASFGGNADNQIQSPDTGPKTKDDVYRTDSEHRMERLRQQLQNPIKLSDIKTNDAFKQIENDKPLETGPKTKDDVYKTDTERGMEKLMQQLKNPRKIDLSQFSKNKGKNLEKLKQALSTNKPISFAELNKRMKEEEPQQPEATEPLETGPKTKDDVYRTDTERGMEKLMQQLQNPRKIDLSQFGKNRGKDLEKLKQALSTDKPISFAELNKRMKEEEPQHPKATEPLKTGPKTKDDVYRTDTENGLERLRQQLQNPRKIDLSRIPRR